MTRATSTVVDVTLFLLLVSAAATVVVSDADQPPERGTSASERAELLATSTASVEYDLRVPGDTPSWVANGSETRRRTAHGTVAQLLGRAAMSRVRIDDTRLSRSGLEFERQVAQTTRTRLRDRHVRTSVRVAWEPYPDAPMSARYTVGPTPPPGTAVEAATVTVSSGVGNATGAALTAARSEGYEGVAAAVAQAIVAGLFPPDQSRVALQGDYPADALVAARYRRLAELTGEGPLALGTTSTARLNRQLAAALADVLVADVRDTFASPEAAARHVETDRVTITVRTWSP